MTQEEKQLVLVDLSGRYLYGVKIQYNGEIKEVQYIEPLYNEVKLLDSANYTIGISEIKLYLRPMSSMTEEERKEYKHLVAFSGSSEGAANLVDWLNKKMFAYRTINGKDMFELGFALEAPEGMYGKEGEK